MKKIRQDQNLSQTELAKRTGLSQPTIARLENGGLVRAHWQTVSKIAAALNVTADELLASTGRGKIQAQ